MDSLLLHTFLITLLSLTHPTPITGNVELRALLQLKPSLDPQGHLLPSWTAERDPCRGDFEGVACNEDGKVVNISLQGKGLSGTISPSVAGLKCLTGLYLHYNAISGMIPTEIANLTDLSELYLNVNNLSGGIPEEIGNMGGLQGLVLISARTLMEGVASPLISLEYSNGWDPLADGRSGVGFSEEVSQSFRFNLEEVESATQYFSEVNLLGKSNFASTYKGILRDGMVVAVKSINKTSCKTEEAEFLKGLKLLTLLRHENLVKLRGFCCSRERGECFLVYDFVANGKLSGYLDVKGDENGRILQWPVRVSIIKGIAKGIEYLHSNRANKPSLVHQSISADNILIDHRFTPLLSSSGLHNLLADDVVFSTLKASAAMGYLAPEYTIVGRFTLQSDVFAFGILLFQILAGKKRTTQLRLVAEAGNFEDVIDENLKGDFPIHEVKKLVGIALLCTREEPNQRPTMESVLQELNSSC